MERKSANAKKIRKEEATIWDSLSPKSNKSMIAYHETGNLFEDTCEIIESAQRIASRRNRNSKEILLFAKKRKIKNWMRIISEENRKGQGDSIDER